MRTIDQMAADRVAFEVALLVQHGSLDSRSPAGDALIEYVANSELGDQFSVPIWMQAYRDTPDGRRFARGR